VVLAAGVVALGIVVVIEVVGRRMIERAAESELAAQGFDGAEVVVGRSWWRPALLPAVVGGALDRVHVTLVEDQVAGVQVRRADYELRGLQVDLRPGSTPPLRVTGIDGGTFRVELDAEQARALGVAQGATVPDLGLLPCDPEVSERNELVVLGCSGDRLPAVLDSPLGATPSDGSAPGAGPTELRPPEVLEREAPGSGVPTTTGGGDGGG
jgi:hypothetical protein